ncbi:LTA synthase family protein [Flavobacterium jejuense]|uniref:LTA synthase family protein n=1 Tax=Flavobacterium jejuense TaxID=1544455 RepID=A0ABX0IMP1_9FLAO|nr:LTA synthase family protein [Flavobacterium jejuense]NHN24983.1 LTA synthase family protein [Flavobacterium jejuense]
MIKLLVSKSRYALLRVFNLWFLLFSFLLRLVFFIWHFDEVSLKISDVLLTFCLGFVFDTGVCFMISLPFVIYLSIFPNKWIGSLFDKIIIYFFSTLTLFTLVFTFLAEITFWEEFKNRFNFIAVDYLIYTYEVISNIKESYNLTLLIGIVLFITLLLLFLFHKKKAYSNTFAQKITVKTRLLVFFTFSFIVLFYIKFIPNTLAERMGNRYNDEISKAGIYSFFAAFRNNQMKYQKFYTTIDNDKAFAIIKHKLEEPNSKFNSKKYPIHRKVNDNGQINTKGKNVVFILVESLSASFLNKYGNQENITPFLDSLTTKSFFFDNLYATGTRTVRGMEAVTLCIPPTPGQSIVKRPENHNLFTISNVFKSKKYKTNFFYGGDGYFDNMNSFFGGNGFDIYDRGRGSILNDEIKTNRYNIEDNEVTFENAWGICDENLFDKMITVADKYHNENKLFFNFVMTTSNHRPYTYPEGKIDILSGTGRSGAVKYTDYALQQLFRKAKQKEWYKNTIFVIIADHCASSAGKNEIDIANYHIPAFIVNASEIENQIITKQCSQIDLFPTLFGIMNWSYESDFFGKNVLSNSFEERALLGTYRKLTLMKQDKAMILSDQKKQTFNKWDKESNNLTQLPMDNAFLEETIAWYQTADYLFTNKLLN